MLRWCCCFLIGGVLLVTAVGKSIDMQGLLDVLGTYHLFPDWSFWPLAIGIMGIEWGLAVWILIGW